MMSEHVVCPLVEEHAPMTDEGRKSSGESAAPACCRGAFASSGDGRHVHAGRGIFPYKSGTAEQRKRCLCRSRCLLRPDMYAAPAESRAGPLRGAPVREHKNNHAREAAKGREKRPVRFVPCTFAGRGGTEGGATGRL